MEIKTLFTKLFMIFSMRSKKLTKVLFPIYNKKRRSGIQVIYIHQCVVDYNYLIINQIKY
jgi:hypothetical protein